MERAKMGRRMSDSFPLGNGSFGKAALRSLFGGRSKIPYSLIVNDPEKSEFFMRDFLA